MNIYIKAYDKREKTNINLLNEDEYRICVTEKGQLYIKSLTEKDEDGYDKVLNVDFVIEAK